MTSKELLSLAQTELESIKEAYAPIEAMLKVLSDLKDVCDRQEEEIKNLQQEETSLKTKLARKAFEMQQVQGKISTGERELRNQRWVAQELGKFVSDIANGIHSGTESAAARRVFDLYKGDIRKKRLNCVCHESLSEAEEFFKAQGGINSPSNKEFLEWLFQPAEK